eukprot:gene5041-biopygen3638
MKELRIRIRSGIDSGPFPVWPSRSSVQIGIPSAPRRGGFLPRALHRRRLLRHRAQRAARERGGVRPRVQAGQAEGARRLGEHRPREDAGGPLVVQRRPRAWWRRGRRAALARPPALEAGAWEKGEHRSDRKRAAAPAALVAMLGNRCARPTARPSAGGGCDGRSRVATDHDQSARFTPGIYRGAGAATPPPSG